MFWWLIFQQPPKKGQGGDIYSAFAVFKNPKEAQQAFEQIEGSPDEVTKKEHFLYFYEIWFIFFIRHAFCIPLSTDTHFSHTMPYPYQIS